MRAIKEITEADALALAVDVNACLGRTALKSEKSVPCRSHPNDEIRIGRSSWSDQDWSVKYTWFDKTGRAARGGEVPLVALPQMLEFAIREGHLSIGPE